MNADWLSASRQRLPPQNVAAEQALLGAILANNKCYDRVAFLRPEMFADPILARIYHAAARRIEAGQLADPITLKAEFENTGILAEVGGTAYLVKLLTAMVGINIAPEYGRAIRDCWLRRRQIEIAQQLAGAAYGDGDDASAADILVRHEDEIAALRETGIADATAKRGPVTALDAFEEAISNATARAQGRMPRAYGTGLRAVDAALAGGIEPESFTALIGASEAGKSELAVQICEYVAADTFRSWVGAGCSGPCPGVLYIMLGDMSVAKIGTRIAARAIGMSRRRAHDGAFDGLDPARLVEARDAVTKMAMEIRDDVPSTLAGILGEVRRFVRRRPLVALFVDNFTDLLSMDVSNMYSVAVSVTKALKDNIVKRYECAVVLLMHTKSSDEHEERKTGKRTVPAIPYNTKGHFTNAVFVRRPFLYLPTEPKELNEKGKQTGKGQEIEAQWQREWSDARQDWPVGVRNVTEVSTLKMQDAGDARGDVGLLRFDAGTNRYYDVPGPPTDAAWDG